MAKWGLSSMDASASLILVPCQDNNWCLDAGHTDQLLRMFYWFIWQKHNSSGVELTVLKHGLCYTHAIIFPTSSWPDIHNKENSARPQFTHYSTAHGTYNSCWTAFICYNKKPDAVDFHIERRSKPDNREIITKPLVSYNVMLSAEWPILWYEATSSEDGTTFVGMRNNVFRDILLHSAPNTCKRSPTC